MRSLVVAMPLLSACFGGTIDTGGGDGADAATAGAPDAASPSAHAFCVQETNRYRQMDGHGPVGESATLEAYADEGAAYDFSANPHDHFRATSGGGIAFAENECPHWDLSFGGGDLEGLVAACIQAFYSEGPGGGHYDNMMGAYAHLGCGLYNVGTDYTIVQDYGP